MDDQDIKFDENVPIPPARSQNKYNLHLMEPGHSKFWPGEGSACSKAAAVYSKKSGRKFTVRRVEEKHPDESGAMQLVRGERVWRLPDQEAE